MKNETNSGRDFAIKVMEALSGKCSGADCFAVNFKEEEDGTRRVQLIAIDSEGENGPGLATLQQAVGGYIEVLPLPDTGWEMVTNEEAKLSNDHAVHPIGTDIWQGVWNGANGDYIAGSSIVLCRIGVMK